MLLLLALAVGGALPFLASFDANFVNWDDPANFVNNQGYRGLGAEQLQWMFTTTLTGHYIPLTWLTLGLNYAIGGMNPRGYHVGNVLLHSGNTVLFYWAARRLIAAAMRSGRTDATVICGAALSALVFAVHPLRAESVAWITERRDVLCAAFYLLSILAYLRAVERGGSAGGRWRGLSLAAMGAALLSKAMAMTLPLTLLLLDVYPLRRTRLGWRVLAREKIPYAVLAVMGAFVAVVAVSRGAAWTSYDAYGAGARVAMVAYTLWFYPSRLVWPHALSPLYELPPHIDPLDAGFLFCILAVLIVSAVLIAARHRLPAGLTAWVHSAIVLLPVSGVVHAGHQLAHDRYSYLSGLGFAVLAGGGLSWVVRQWQGRAVSGWVTALVCVTAMLAVCGWGIGAARQTRVWSTSETLWQAAVDADPSCGICRNNLGIAITRTPHLESSRLREAEAHFRRAIALRPAYPDAYANLGVVLVRQGRLDEAEAVFRSFVQAFPALSDGPLRLGMLLRDMDRDAEAVLSLRRALQISPGFDTARLELGQMLVNQGARLVQAGRPSEAIGLFQEAATLLPGDALPLRNLGLILADVGRSRDAIAVLERALELSAGDATAHYGLVRAYRGAGQASAAMQHLVALRRLDASLAARVEQER